MHVNKMHREPGALERPGRKFDVIKHYPNIKAKLYSLTYYFSFQNLNVYACIRASIP